MASKIILKKSSLAAKVPVAGDLDFGELAINYTDSKLYFKKADGSIESFSAGITGTVTSVGGTGTVAGLSLSGTVTTSGNLSLSGTLSTPVSTINDSTTVGQNFVKLADPNAITFLRVNADNTVSTLSGSAFRTAIGGTTIGRNIFTLTNPSAVTFLQMNADNTASALDAASFRTAIGAGTVTSVGGSGTVSGLSLSGTVTTSGNLSLSGTLAVTPSNFASQTANTVLAAPNGSAGTPTFRTLVAGDIPALTLENLPDAWTKRSAKVATTANITLSGTQTIDGIAVVAGDRVLVKDQTTASQNGIYVVAAGAWARSTDADLASELGAAQIGVDSGTVNGGYTFDTDFKTTDTLGTTAMNWSRVLDAAYLTTVGNSLATLTNPSAITFLQVNANNTVSALSAASFRTAIGAGTSSTTGTVTAVTGTAPVVSSGGTAPAISMAAATATVNGYMTSTYAAKLDGIAAGATANTGTVTAVTGTAPVVSSGGTAPAISMAAATATVNGYMTSTYAAKLDGIAAGATANTGTVTSVATSGTVSGLTLTGGTITTSGTITLGGTLAVTPSNFASQTANTVLAAPNGAAGVPTFRALVATDIPTLNQNTTGNAATATTLATSRTIALTGDVSYTSGSFNGSANVTGTATLATVNANVGSFGSSTTIPVVTVNAKGLVTAVSTATVSGGQYFGTAATKAIAYNANTIGENITVTTGNNGLSAGPITVSSGFTVTVQSGAVWTVV